MNWYKEAVLLLLVILMLASIPGGSVELEYKPGEKVAEDLFNHGKGEPWLGGNYPKSEYWTPSWKWPKHPIAVTPHFSYKIMGYIYVDESMRVTSDSGDSIELLAGPGSYPIYGYYMDGYLLGIFVDMSGSQRPVETYPSLSSI